MGKNILNIILIILFITTLTSAQSIVGKWSRNNGHLLIYDNGKITATYDNNQNRRWKNTNGIIYKYTGPNSEILTLTLLENGKYFALSNGQLWKKTDNVKTIIGKWKRNNGFIVFKDNGCVTASYDNNKNRKWKYSDNGIYHFTGPNGEKQDIQLFEEGKKIKFSNNQVWEKVN